MDADEETPRNDGAPRPEVIVVDTRTVPPEEVAIHEVAEADDEVADPIEAVERPAKVMRIGSMIKQLLDEVRHSPLDDASRARMREIYDTSVMELANTLSPELAAELHRMTPSLDSAVPSDAELRVAQAQLVGWLEGLFHGIQATLFAQQMAARQIDEARQRGLPAGSLGDPAAGPPSRPAGYL
jgi:hypothetical protein